MTDEKPTDESGCSPEQKFVIPGTPDVACGADADLQHCVHCGAGLSPNSEFCHVCSTAVSGGHLPDDHEHEAAADEENS